MLKILIEAHRVIDNLDVGIKEDDSVASTSVDAILNHMRYRGYFAPVRRQVAAYGMGASLPMVSTCMLNVRKAVAVATCVPFIAISSCLPVARGAFSVVGARPVFRLDDAPW